LDEVYMAEFVFVVATGPSTRMARLSGRAKRGRRMVGLQSLAQSKRIFGAGFRPGRLTSPLTIDCAMNGAVFIE
jgi:hypothetical protein